MYVQDEGFSYLLDRSSRPRCAKVCRKAIEGLGKAAACYSGQTMVYSQSTAEALSRQAASTKGKGKKWKHQPISDPEPTDPAPTEPTPTDPAPTEPTPTEPTPTDPSPEPGSSTYVPQGYSLAWADEFNTLSLNNGWQSTGSNWYSYWVNWGVRHLGGNSDEGVKLQDETVLASGRTANAALRSVGSWGARERYLHEATDGTLKLRAYPLSSAIRSEFWGFPYAASMISGENVYTQRYGYWEVKARANRLGQGHHIAVWLLPSDNSWPPEIDMLETVGLDPAKFHANSHGEPENLPISYYTAPNGANGWHVFGFEWTPDTMRWTVNGQTVREHANYINDKDLHFLISWEIGSSWPGDPDGSTPWPAEYEVDYVRIYKK